MVDSIAVIGCGAAGATAAMQARKQNRSVSIWIFDVERHSQYSRCGLPYTISGKVAKFEDVVLTPPESWEGLKITAHLGVKVTEIDHSAHSLTAEGVGGSVTVNYDALIFATGSYNVTPPVKGLDKKHIYGLRTLDDAKALSKEAEKAKDVVVIGGGLIGMETAEALHERGLRVTVVEFLPYVLPAMVDADMGEIIQEHCRSHGLQILVNTAALEVVGNERPESVIVKDRATEATSSIPADVVVVATGVRANTALAEQIGVKVGPTRGIIVNDRMETNLPNVYACGDCAEHVDFVTKKPAAAGLGTVAVRQGRVAGINAAGGDVRFPGIVGAKVTKLFGLEIASTGITEELAKRYELSVVKGSVRGLTKPPYYTGGKELKVKTYFDRDSGRLVGGQLVGVEDAAMRLNVLTMGIQRGVDAAGLFDFENCYAPAVCDTWDPLVTSADAARKRLKT
ncbi:MAG: FAD-dependent oxidoreductase [Candidatus Thorarchaeota archaeon]|nr:FAD-dependent oxidoreductase [Candidatus Thorarchaeota archaeon]